MVAFKTLAAATLAAVVPASAYITGIVAPDTVTGGTTATITVKTASYIQNWQDFGIAWGLTQRPVNDGADLYIGTQIDYTNIYPEQEPLGNFTTDIKIPSGYTGDWTLVAAVPYLVGASGLVKIESFTTNVTFA